jgi:hypothetical protein
MAEETVLYAAVYHDVHDALADLDAFEQVHEESMIGKYNATVIAHESGKARIIKRADHPHIRVIKRDFSAAIDKLSGKPRQGLES